MCFLNPHLEVNSSRELYTKFSSLCKRAVHNVTSTKPTQLPAGKSFYLVMVISCNNTRQDWALSGVHSHTGPCFWRSRLNLF